MNKIKLGSYAKDIITGFSGVVTAHAKYLSGCDQYCIRPNNLDKDGNIKDALWFDVEQIEVNSKAPLKINSRPTGGPQMDAPEVN